MNFTIHDETGQIIRTGFCPDGAEVHQAGVGESMLPHEADLDLHYVANGAIAERPTNPAKLIGTTLLNLPMPCMVTINGRDYQCDESTVDLGFTHVGTYQVKVSAFPYLDAHFKVTK